MGLFGNKKKEKEQEPTPEVGTEDQNEGLQTYMMEPSLQETEIFFSDQDLDKELNKFQEVPFEKFSFNRTNKTFNNDSVFASSTFEENINSSIFFIDNFMWRWFFFLP